MGWPVNRDGGTIAAGKQGQRHGHSEQAQQPDGSTHGQRPAAAVASTASVSSMCGNLQITHLPLYLLQQGTGGLGFTCLAIKILFDGSLCHPQVGTGRINLTGQQPRRALSNLSLRFSRTKNDCSGDSSAASGDSMRLTRTRLCASLSTSGSSLSHQPAGTGHAFQPPWV
jgi:hypothetical protein